MSESATELSAEQKVKARVPTATCKSGRSGSIPWFYIKVNHPHIQDTTDSALGSGESEQKAWEQAARNFKL